MRRARALLALVVVALLATSVVGTATASNNAINYDAGPNPGVEEDTLTIAEHDRGEMDVLEYYDDNGDVVELPAHLNTSKDEQVSVRFDRINVSSLGEFPRDKDEVSGLDADEWTVGGPQSGELTVSDATPAEGVEAVEFATGGSFADGDSAHATFSNFSVDSDAEKRVLLLIGSVETLDSGATVTINLTSTDGDTVSATIDSSATQDHTVAATSTINGFVFQEKVSNLTVSGSGDGTMEDIQNVNYTVEDGDATVVLTALDAERKSKLDLGKRVGHSPGARNREARSVGRRLLYRGGSSRRSLQLVGAVTSFFGEFVVVDVVSKVP